MRRQVIQSSIPPLTPLFFLLNIRGPSLSLHFAILINADAGHWEFSEAFTEILNFSHFAKSDARSFPKPKH